MTYDNQQGVDIFLVVSHFSLIVLSDLPGSLEPPGSVLKESILFKSFSIVIIL